MRVAPGPPHYQYGASVVVVDSPNRVLVDLRVRYQRIDAQGDQDYGLGLRREDGWLVYRTHVTLYGVDWMVGGAAKLRELLPRDQRCVVKIIPGVADNLTAGVIVRVGEEIPVNQLMLDVFRPLGVS